MEAQYNISKLTENLFRRESARMVSVLTRIFGMDHLETAEDVVQQTFMDALRVWALKGMPENPSAWLFRVAKNKTIDVIRRNRTSVSYDFEDDERKLLNSEYTIRPAMDSLWQEELVSDDQLRMMFACCHPKISPESQVTLILKTLCGFSTAEIASAFLTNEETITKRLYRTKEFFRENKVALDIPSVAELKSRTSAVLSAVYLLFNEGYNSTESADLIRPQMMKEAMMLCGLLAENAHTQLPEVFALMALICFHYARSESRMSPEGEIVLLANQDRSQWNDQMISLGNYYMNLAAKGDEVSTYHLEAAIAWEHCSAKSFEQTNWKRIVDLYDWLERLKPSPIIGLHKAVAVLQMEGAEVALKRIEELGNSQKLDGYYLYNSLLGELYCQLGRFDEAETSLKKALMQTRSDMEKRLLKKKIEQVRAEI